MYHKFMRAKALILFSLFLVSTFTTFVSVSADEQDSAHTCLWDFDNWELGQMYFYANDNTGNHYINLYNRNRSSPSYLYDRVQDLWPSDLTDDNYYLRFRSNIADGDECAIFDIIGNDDLHYHTEFDVKFRYPDKVDSTQYITFYADDEKTKPMINISISPSGSVSVKTGSGTFRQLAEDVRYWDWCNLQITLEGKDNYRVILTHRQPIMGPMPSTMTTEIETEDATWYEFELTPKMMDGFGDLTHNLTNFVDLLTDDGDEGLIEFIFSQDYNGWRSWYKGDPYNSLDNIVPGTYSIYTDHDGISDTTLYWHDWTYIEEEVCNVKHIPLLNNYNFIELVEWEYPAFTKFGFDGLCFDNLYIVSKFRPISDTYNGWSVTRTSPSSDSFTAPQTYSFVAGNDYPYDPSMYIFIVNNDTSDTYWSKSQHGGETKAYDVQITRDWIPGNYSLKLETSTGYVYLDEFQITSPVEDEDPYCYPESYTGYLEQFFKVYYLHLPTFGNNIYMFDLAPGEAIPTLNGVPNYMEGTLVYMLSQTPSINWSANFSFVPQNLGIRHYVFLDNNSHIIGEFNVEILPYEGFQVYLTATPNYRNLNIGDEFTIEASIETGEDLQYWIEFPDQSKILSNGVPWDGSAKTFTVGSHGYGTLKIYAYRATKDKDHHTSAMISYTINDENPDGTNPSIPDNGVPGGGFLNFFGSNIGLGLIVCIVVGAVMGILAGGTGGGLGFVGSMILCSIPQVALFPIEVLYGIIFICIIVAVAMITSR